MSFRDAFAIIGVFVVFLALFGALGIGDFRMYYGPNAEKAGCAMGEVHD